MPAALRSGCAVKRNQRRSWSPDAEKLPVTASSSKAMIFSLAWASWITAIAAASRPVSETCRPTSSRPSKSARKAGFASSMIIEGARTMLIMAGAAISTSFKRERFSCVATAHAARSLSAWKSRFSTSGNAFARRDPRYATPSTSPSWSSGTP